MPPKPFIHDFLREATKSETDNCIRLNWKNRPGTTYLGKFMMCSRVVWFMAKGDPGELQVLHTCHDDRCVNIRHLHLGTHQQNMADMVAAGRGMVGERARNGKLNAGQVLAIRAAHAGGQSMSSLARDYEVRLYSIQSIVKRITWNHL